MSNRNSSITLISTSNNSSGPDAIPSLPPFADSVQLSSSQPPVYPISTELENSTALTERSVNFSENDLCNGLLIKAINLHLNIISKNFSRLHQYIIKNRRLALSGICKAFRGPLLEDGNLKVAFTYFAFLALDQEMQASIIGLIQKIGFKLIIEHLSKQPLETYLGDIHTFMSNRPDIFGDDPEPINKITELKVNHWLTTKDDRKKILDFIAGCKLLEILHFDKIESEGGEIQPKFTLPEGLTALTKLSFVDLHNITFITTKNLNTLETLYFLFIDDSYVCIMKEMISLKVLCFGWIRLASAVTVPKSLSPNTQYLYKTKRGIHWV